MRSLVIVLFVAGAGCTSADATTSSPSAAAQEATYSVANPDGDDNPRDWSELRCPAGFVAVGVQYGSMGAFGADFTDGVAPICLQVGHEDQLGYRVTVFNSEIFGEPTYVHCPLGSVATGLGYTEITGPAPNPDDVDGVAVWCEGHGFVSTPDIGAPTVTAMCDAGDVMIGTVYKDKPDPFSDYAEAVTAVCRRPCDAPGNGNGHGHHHGNGNGHGGSNGHGHDCD